MEAQISLFKIIPITDGFHQMRVFQRKVEDITNKFKLIHPDLISHLSENRQRHSSKASEYVTIIKE